MEKPLKTLPSLYSSNFYFCRLFMRLKSFWEKLSHWELWPFALRYVLISPLWVWYILRSRAVWFFTPSNPTLTFGGFEGESKREMYEQLPKTAYPKTIFLNPDWSFDEILETINKHNFTYPFIVKPDVGMEGILFRKIEYAGQLRQYHEKMPVAYLVQELVEHPVEYSVFYYRYPNQQKGVITGFLQKTPLHVIGDGQRTLHQLINEHPRAKHRLAEMQLRHEAYLNDIIAAEEIYYLSHAANLNRGAIFLNLRNEIDEQLHKVFDELNLHSKNFYYGRYDLKA